MKAAEEPLPKAEEDGSGENQPVCPPEKPPGDQVEVPEDAPVFEEPGDPVTTEVWDKPDLDFIIELQNQGGDTLNKCMQCGTCTATCGISPDTSPFPRKEMAWAAWGMKARLMTDPDIWLCYQCNDCSERCPRGARPGDVLAAIRRSSVIEHAAPRFLARCVNNPRYFPFLLTIPIAILALALVAREPIGNLLNISNQTGETIVFSYSRFFPHWLLNGLFGICSVLVLITVATGVRRYWKALKEADRSKKDREPVKSLGASLWAAFKNIVMHRNFSSCKTKPSQQAIHMSIFFGFIALCMVTVWVITGTINPLIRSSFVYPFAFLSPWKILANLGGLALLIGTFSMIFERINNAEHSAPNTYFNWSFLLTLFTVVITGFATELLHYLRLEPHRHVVYFVHLVTVFVLLMNLPFTKFAHLIYRATAQVYAEYTGRDRVVELNTAARKQERGE